MVVPVEVAVGRRRDLRARERLRREFSNEKPVEGAVRADMVEICGGKTVSEFVRDKVVREGREDASGGDEEG